MCSLLDLDAYRQTRNTISIDDVTFQLDHLEQPTCSLPEAQCGDALARYLLLTQTQQTI